MSSALDLGYATMLQSMAAAVPAVVEAAGRRRELAEARPTHAEAPKPRPHLSLSSAAAHPHPAATRAAYRASVLAERGPQLQRLGPAGKRVDASDGACRFGIKENEIEDQAGASASRCQCYPVDRPTATGY